MYAQRLATLSGLVATHLQFFFFVLSSPPRRNLTPEFLHELVGLGAGVGASGFGFGVGAGVGSPGVTGDLEGALEGAYE